MNEEEKQGLLEGLKKRAEFENKIILKALEDEVFRQRLLNDPKSVYAEELGQEIPEGVNVEVIEESATTIYLTLPRNPLEAIAEGELSDEALEAVAGGSWGLVSRDYVLVVGANLKTQAVINPVDQVATDVNIRTNTFGL